MVEANREMESSKQKFRLFKQQFTAEKNRFKELSANAMAIAPLEDEDGNETVLKDKLMNELDQFNTIGLAEAALEEAESKVENIHFDSNAVQRYEEKKMELEDSQQELDNLTSQKEKSVSELERKKEPWFKGLKNLIETIDKRFTKYMSELGCVGEISLKYDNDLNFSFKDYAVEIKVSFRANVAPTVLSSRVQSGGERSVSTIMYLMAMQDMMVSPFRCVDEINQGLDDRNERLVFRRIVENSTQPPGPGGPTDHCGQYWLITPKLLPNLNDMEVAAMNVICIFNGKLNEKLKSLPLFVLFLTAFLFCLTGAYNLEKPQDWSTEDFVATRKRRHDKLGSDIDGDDGKKVPKIGD